KAERQAWQAPAQTNAAAPAMQGQAADSGSKKAGGLVPALNEEVGRDETPVAAAAAAWLVLPDTAGAGAQGAAGEQRAAPDDATPAVPANGVKMVDPNEVNELDLAATPATPAASSWLSYLLATLGAALAAASTVRFFFGRRPAIVRMRGPHERPHSGPLTNVPFMFLMPADRRFSRCRSSRRTKMPP